MKNRWVLPGLVIVLVSLPWVWWQMRTNWFWTSDDFGAIEYVRKFSWWGLVWRAYTTGDPWRFNKFVGYWVIKLGVNWLGVSPLLWIWKMYVVNLINLVLVASVVAGLTGKRWWGVMAAVVVNKWSLYWMSNLHELMAATGILVGTYGWMWKWEKGKKGKWAGLMILGGYLFALGSKEMALLGIAWWMALAWHRKESVGDVVKYVPIGLAVGLWYVVRIKFLGGVSEGHTYRWNWDIQIVLNNGLYYLQRWFGDWSGLKILGLIAVGYWGNKRSLGILVAAVMAVGPVLFFANRRESYYLYLPTIYLASYLGIVGAMWEKKMKYGGWVVVSLICLIWGRGLLPPFTRDNLVNHQKEAVMGVAKEVEARLSEMEVGQRMILDFGKVYEIRDVKVLLDSGTLDLFVRGESGRIDSKRYNGEVEIEK